MLVSPGSQDGDDGAVTLRQTLAERGDGLLAITLRSTFARRAGALPLSLSHGARLEIDPL